MKKVCAVGFSAIFLSAYMAGIADATVITQKFYVEVESISIMDAYDLIAAMAFVPTAKVGEKVFGSISYNDEGIPLAGSYSVPVTELQFWHFDYGGLSSWGFILDPLEGTRLQFTDRLLSGIIARYHADLSTGLEDEYLIGSTAYAWGRFNYDIWVPEMDGYLSFYSEFHTTGVIYFLPTPEPATYPLIIIGAIGLLGLKRKLKNACQHECRLSPSLHIPSVARNSHARVHSSSSPQ